MTLTLSQYATRSFVGNDEESLLFAVSQWVEFVKDDFLAGTPHPLRGAYLKGFGDAVKREANFIERMRQPNGQLLVTSLNIKTRFDRLVNEHLNAREATLYAAMVAGPPVLPHDHEYTTPGVACTGALIDKSGALSGTWANITTYSGNHDSAIGYLTKVKGKIVVAKAIPSANWTMIQTAKQGLADVQCLGDAKHAEDSWFAYHYDDFVKAATALDGITALRPVSEVSVFMQTKSAPRIEFLMSMPPCTRDDSQPQTGCANYFAALRAAVGSRIPIVLYCYRPFEASQGKKQLCTIDANGKRVDHPNVWSRG